MTTLQVMRDRIDDELLRSGDMNTQIVREINSAIKHYESTRFRWNEVRDWTVATTSAGTRYYSLTDDFLRFDTLLVKYNDAFIYLEPKTWDYIEYRDREITATQGIPSEYAIYGHEIRLWPAPNGSYTLQGSYIRRLIAADTNLSLTSTASATTNGWFTFGEELIRYRAKAAVQINYLKDEAAISEMRQFAAMGKSYLSAQEQIAYKRLIDEQFDQQSTNLIRPNYI